MLIFRTIYRIFTKYMICMIYHVTLLKQSYEQVKSVSYLKVGSCVESVSVFHLEHWRHFRTCYVYRQSAQHSACAQNSFVLSVSKHRYKIRCSNCHYSGVATCRPISIDMTHEPDPIKVPQGLTYKTPVVILCTAKFNTQPFYVLPTQCIYVFCVDLRTNSDYFSIQH